MKRIHSNAVGRGRRGGPGHAARAVSGKNPAFSFFLSLFAAYLQFK